MVGGHAWQRACIAEGMNSRGYAWQRACMAEGMHGRGACMVEGGMCGGRGTCMVREMATAADSMHPTGMHSCSAMVTGNA